MALKAGADAGAAELTTLGERELRDRILTRPLPRHVAIIMDGNGRWATSRGMPRVAGHREGVKAVRNTVRAAGEVGIEYLTLYAFSSENWNRPRHEVSTLMNLLERSIDRELPELMARKVRFRVIGRPNGVPPEVQRRIDHVVDATAANTGLTLLMAFNYGARRRRARPGPPDPHQWRDAPVELPALADRLYGALGDGHALARLRAARSLPRGGELPAA